MRDCALPSLKGPLCFYRRTCFQFLSCQAGSCCIQQLCIWLKYGTITPTCWEANEGLLKDIFLELHYLPRVSCVLFYFLPILPCRSLFQAAHLAALNVPRHVLFALTYVCSPMVTFPVGYRSEQPRSVIALLAVPFFQWEAVNWDTSFLNAARSTGD